MPQMIVHNKEERFSYLSSAKAAKSNSRVHVEHYSSTTDRLQQMA